MTRHLLTVWNPSYAADPLDDHLRILLRWAELYRKGDCDYEEVYVWWAKLRSLNRKPTELPHHDDVLALQAQMERGVETHLYLTDYRSLYVANMEDVTADDLLDDDEAGHMPEYYRTRRADFWFRIVDIRRVVFNDTLGVIEELKKLTNTRYHDRPVSLYGGMVELPLIVTRADGKQWFPEATSLTEGLLWAQHDAALRGETDRLGRELRDNLLGPVVWAVLDPAARTFLASADATFRSRRDDPNFDFSGPAVGYAKAVEAELNALLFGCTRDVMAKQPRLDRLARVDGKPLDLGDTVPHQTLGTILNLLRHDDTFARALKLAFAQSDWKWLLGELPSRLEPIVAVRNMAAHGSTSTRRDVEELRAQVLGIGCEGLIVQVARVRLRNVA
jgi:hypothetical protein